MDAAKHFLYPSTLYAEKAHTYITTILGSCVAVCLYDSYLQQGGINHYMLPFWNGHGLASPKYGNIAIEKLIEKMQIMSSKKNSLIAKVFGGAEVLQTTDQQFLIGKRNIAIAQKTLEEYKIPIVSSSTGGNIGRKIIFNTLNGEVMMKFVGQNK